MCARHRVSALFQYDPRPTATLAHIGTHVERRADQVGQEWWQVGQSECGEVPRR